MRMLYVEAAREAPSMRACESANSEIRCGTRRLAHDRRGRRDAAVFGALQQDREQATDGGCRGESGGDREARVARAVLRAEQPFVRRRIVERERAFGRARGRIDEF